MDGASKRFQGLRLNQKFTLAILCVVLVPVMLFAFILFSNTYRLITEDKIKDIESNLIGVQTNVEKAVDLCNMTTQVFQNSSALRDFLCLAKKDEGLPIDELLDFHRSEFALLERLVTTNPYLYQVRVYYDNESIPEQMPILYHSSRMQRLSWAEGDWQSATWQFNYADTIFPPVVTKPAEHIMSLVTTIEDNQLGTIGILEVSVRMDEIMTGLFEPGDEKFSSFITHNGTWCYDESSVGFFRENDTELLKEIDLPAREIKTVPAVIDGEKVWITSVPLYQIGGQYMIVTLPSEITGQLNRFLHWYILGLVVLLALLALIINMIVKAMLRRLYKIFNSITEVRKGNLNVRVPDLGDDEVGLLGKQLNLMLERIVHLMKENVNRQLLAKNSEIRALQSQINAHFIYNVLESIKMTAELDEKYEIADAIQSLGELLRYSMRWPSSTVTVAEEVENAENYLSLINLRFDYRVTLRNNLPPYTMKLAIPKMTLQPIIENAVVHGVNEMAENAFIDLDAQQVGSRVLLSITDYGKGLNEDELASLRQYIQSEMDPDSGKGIGLKNVNDRIVMAFGENCGIDIQSIKEQFTRITICIPGRKKQEVTIENASNS